MSGIWCLAVLRVLPCNRASANCGKITRPHKIPTPSFVASALYLEIVRLAYNLSLPSSGMPGGILTELDASEGAPRTVLLPRGADSFAESSDSSPPKVTGISSITVCLISGDRSGLVQVPEHVGFCLVVGAVPA